MAVAWLVLLGAVIGAIAAIVWIMRDWKWPG
ncbi:hypothetical protein QO013_001304 [Azospirillum rugosum]|nr:hypothetical protein [Azospirillum rugosum]